MTDLYDSTCRQACGEFTMAADQGRVTIPAVFRRGFPDAATIALGTIDLCIVGVPFPEDMPERVHREMLAHIEASELFVRRWDCRGRIAIPKQLLRGADKKRLVFVLLGESFELWDEQAWGKQKADFYEAFEKWLEPKLLHESAVPAAWEEAGRLVLSKTGLLEKTGTWLRQRGCSIGDWWKQYVREYRQALGGQEARQ